jgi:PAS domain S-box-containing protein
MRSVGLQLGRIIEHKRAEKALRESEQRFRDFAEASSDWFWQTDERLCFTWNSQRRYELFDSSPESVLGRRREEVANADLTDPRWKRHLADLEARQPFKAFRYSVKDGTGRVRHIEVSGKPIFEADGAFRGYCGVGADVTNQIEAEERAKSAQKHLSVALDSLSEFVTLFDAEDRLVVSNRAWRELNSEFADATQPGTGYEDCLRAGLSAGFFPDAEGREDEWLRERLDQHRNPTGPFESPQKDSRWLLIDEQRLPDGGTITIATDITERKKVEQLKNEFVSTVSHELRTPLTSVAGSLGLIAGGVGGELTDRGGQLIEIARNNCDRLVRLINDMLDLEKMESGRMEFRLAPVPLGQLVEHAVEETRAYGEGLGVSFAIENGIGAETVLADRDRLTQVITNLLSNAAKFSPKGDVVRVNMGRNEANLFVSVTDRGPGVPAEFRDRIFQKFAQADGSDNRKMGGTGLGLAIVKGIVDRLDGEVWFETETDKGTNGIRFSSVRTIATSPILSA